MAAPVVQFAPMRDGGRVAFHIVGKGPAVALLFPYHVNHLTLNWRVPLHRGAIQFLARHFTVINLDFRGAGLSDPLNCELSLDSLRDALDTVLVKVGVQALGLCAMGAAGLIACHFASRMPHRVTRRVFIGSGESEANRQLLHIRQTGPRAISAPSARQTKSPRTGGTESRNRDQPRNPFPRSSGPVRDSNEPNGLILFPDLTLRRGIRLLRCQIGEGGVRTRRYRLQTCGLRFELPGAGRQGFEPR